MPQLLDETLAPRLARQVEAIQRHATPIILFVLAATVVLGAYAVTTIGINMDTLKLLSEDLPSRQRLKEFSEHFPNLEEALLVVIDAKTPAQARDASDRLSALLSEDQEHFTRVYVPGGGEFFEVNGLLYRTVDELDRFADRMATIQPLLGELERDPSISTIVDLVERGLEDESGDLGIEGDEWSMLLDRVGQATVSVYDEFPVRISWEEMLLSGSQVEVPTKRVIIVDPVLDYGKLMVAARAMTAIYDAAKTLELDEDHGILVRVTGNPALNHEEMIALAWDIGGGILFCFILTAAILQAAMRSWRLVVAAIVTLVVGLIWSAAFAAATVGHLNLVSIAFSILFIGLGVDFSIHLGLIYAEALRNGESADTAMPHAVKNIGGSLALCSVTTATGFFVFVPTDYRGVAELGLIAGTGMLIILVLTLYFFPALMVRWLRIPDDQPPPAPRRPDAGLLVATMRHPKTIRWAAIVVTLGSLLLVTHVRFDANVVEMRDPSTPSVQAFNELLADSDMSPWYLNVMVDDLDEAEKLAVALEAKPSVARVVHLGRFIPKDQDEKEEILLDLAMMLEAPPTAGDEPKAPRDIEAETEALRSLRDTLAAPWLQKSRSELAPSMIALHDQLDRFLERLAKDDDKASSLATFEDLLLGSLPDQMKRLRRALEAQPITLDDLPEDLVRRMRAADGTIRLQVFPESNLKTTEDLRVFVDDVYSVTPSAAGIAANLVAFADSTIRSFIEALGLASVLIIGMLVALWRRLGPVILIVTPLAVGAVATVATMGVFDVPFNFANVVVLPLLFGIGVDSGIHLVHRAQEEGPDAPPLRETTTGAAVLFSAITTTASFGSLALSGHQGMASLGKLLTAGMLWMIAANLILLPALLELGWGLNHRAPKDEPGSEASG